MKRYYIILLFTSYCFAFYAQTNIVWYNQGIVNSSGNSNSQTSIYIDGDIQFANEASGSPTPTTPSMIIEKSRVKLLGNLLNDVNKGVGGGVLFALPVSGNNGVIEFCGSTSQDITTTKTTNDEIPSKLFNYINFPNIDINNSAHVTLDARLGAKAQDISLTKGWLILDSKIAEANVDGGLEVNETQETVLAHLLVEGDIDYGESLWNSKPANERGFIQVNLKIPGEGNQIAKSIVGFGIPFNEMRNDYFMFNTLLEPVPEGFLANPPLIDPKTVMTAGKGYVVGIDLRGTDPEAHAPLEGYEEIIKFDQRAINGYRFNRHAFAQYSPDNQLFGNDPMVDAYQKEKLNIDDITVNLTAGYNYLANPYTSPLNIDKLLGNDEAFSTWGIHADVLSAQPQMRNQVWVLAPNSVAELTSNIKNSKYTYNYQVAMKTGGTYDGSYNEYDNVPGVTAIAPLQMFVIRAFSTASTITIPKDERVMGTSRFLRSTPRADRRLDDFIIEFRDISTNTSDRASIVLRLQDELNNSNYLNVERLESASSENSNGVRSASNIKADFTQSLASQIYTKDNGGKPLTVQFLPIETTDKIKLYHIPSTQAQPLHILGLRLETKDKVAKMWLEDTKYNNEVEITPNMLYKTYSEPTDSHERFNIRFSLVGTGINDTQEDKDMIYAYAKNGSVFVEGFEEKDFGGCVELIDVNGKTLTQKIINQPNLHLIDNCFTGVYIIKIQRLKPKTLKVIVKT